MATPKSGVNRRKKGLDLLGGDFTIELINGANNILDCYDITDERAIALWDRHLSQGKTVRGMGNTDAHLPQAIGDAWNGLVLKRPSKRKVLDALWPVISSPLMPLSSN